MDIIQLPSMKKYAILHKQLNERPVGQAVKTPPFHGGNMGSSPVRVTSKKHRNQSCAFLLFGDTVRIDLNPSVRASKLDLRCFAEVLRSGKYRCLYGVQNSILFALWRRHTDLLESIGSCVQLAICCRYGALLAISLLSEINSFFKQMPQPCTR